MDYLACFKAPFSSRNWLKNIALQAVCSFIPIVGPIVVDGYGSDVIAARVINRQAQIPDFDFNMFVRYLKRGLWPFLVKFVTGIIMIPCMVLSLVPLFVGFASNDPVGASAGFFGYFILLLLSIIFTTIITMPFAFRSMLLQDFAKSFDMPWCFAMLRATIVQNIVIVFIFALLTLPTACLTIITFTLATYILIPIFTNIHWHLMVAEYHLFLDKGGTPLTPVGYDDNSQPRGFDIVRPVAPPQPPTS